MRCSARRSRWCGKPVLSGLPRAASRPAKLYRSERHGDRGLRRVDHRDAERLFQRATMARHSGATHDYRLSAVLFPQPSSDVDHAPEGPFASEAVGKPHLKQIAHVPGDRALAYCDDAEAARARKRGEDTAFGDAEYWPRGAFAADVQPWIAVARDHECVGRIVRLHQAPQRHHYALDVGLRFDADRSFREGGTHDLRTV